LAIVLDTWGLIAHLRDEPAAEQVRDAWLEHGAAICSINLGEALYLEIRVRGSQGAGGTIEAVRAELAVIEPDWELVKAAAVLKAGGGLSYADCFGIATARRLEAPLLTGDPEIVERSGVFGCEVVDLR
jgi:predicted nucleic acid-binding protein